MCKTLPDASPVTRHKATHRILLALSLLIATPLFYGCATTEELDSMRATVSAAISANKRSVDAQMRQLEDARKKAEDQQAQLAKQIQDLSTKVTDHQAILDEQGRLLTVHRDTMNRLSDTVRTSTGDIRELKQQLQSETGAISKILDAEEAFHKQGLRSLQAVRHDLSTLRSGSIHTRSASGGSSLDLEQVSHDERPR